jgi:hypothetical protein
MPQQRGRVNHPIECMNLVRRSIPSEHDWLWL